MSEAFLNHEKIMIKLSSQETANTEKSILFFQSSNIAVADEKYFYHILKLLVHFLFFSHHLYAAFHTQKHHHKL